MNAIKRFFRSVSAGPGDCWSWTAGKFSKGYGQFWYSGKVVTAHKFSYLLSGCGIPPGADIDHICGNRACVNPIHLETVSHHENILRGNTGRYKRRKREKLAV